MVMELEDFFRTHTRCALGFSGGTDSAYLLAAGIKMGADIKPYFVRTAFQPGFELDDARQLCDGLGVGLTVLEHDILAVPGVAENPRDRCYFCKWAIFSFILSSAAADGYDTVIDGTNASDDISDRPGWRALQELGIFSPLRECGITKPELRRRSAELGLFTAKKSAYACLATRVPVGIQLTHELLEKIERGEGALADMGYTDFRVRVTREGYARLELREEQIERAVREREALLRALEPEFGHVTLDLKGR